MTNEGTMLDWIKHGLHDGETIEQVEFFEAPPDSGIPLNQKMRIKTAAKYLDTPEAAHGRIRVNTVNSLQGDRVMYIVKHGCIWVTTRAWYGLTDLKQHYLTCPGRHTHEHETVPEHEEHQQ